MKTGRPQISKRKITNSVQRFATIALAASSLWIASLEAVYGQNADTQRKVNAAIGNWKSVTPEILRDPANVDLLQALRSIAKDPRQTAARVPLIKLGDEDVIRSCLEELRSERRSSAMNQLGMAGNPKIIPLLASVLYREESPKKTRLSEDLWTLPISMAAASVVKATILNSSEFSNELKEWAKHLPAVSPGLRDGVRVWWKVNQAAIERGDYQAVVPVENTPGTPPVQSAPSTSVSAVTPAASPSPETLLAQAPAPAPEQRSPVWLWVGGGILVLIVIAALALRRRA